MRFDTSSPIPLLIVGDGPDLRTGLGRIGHDLAWILSSMPQFKVGYMGRLGFGRAKFPWASYSVAVNEQWGEGRIQEAWNDLASDRHGIVFTVWDASRLLWFADPSQLPDDGLRGFLTSGKFERWGYFMLDSEGPWPGTLPLEQAHVLTKYDRALIASRWGADTAARSMTHSDLDWLPHPINRNTFKPSGREAIRSAWGIGQDETLIGCVMSNQERKLWPVVFEAVAQMESKPRLWIHPDRMFHVWDITALAVEYGISDRVIYENRPLSDKELAMRYSACDVTTVMSGGEGFCYPVAESLSCNTPVVTGYYGAQAELCEPNWLVPVQAFEIRTNHNIKRAVYNAVDVRQRLEHVVERRREGMEAENSAQSLVEHLDFGKITPLWKQWFERGLACS